jgi:hypothetical protein
MYRGECPGDEHKDCGMIQTHQYCARGTAWHQQVVDAAHGQQEHTREGEYAEGRDAIAVAAPATDQEECQPGEYECAD